MFEQKDDPIIRKRMGKCHGLSTRSCLLTLLCLTATVSSCGAFWLDAHTVECEKTPPGVRLVFRGVDITTLDLLPLEIQNENGYKSPVVNLTCNHGRVYSRGSEVYELPDQVWGFTNKPGGWLSTDVHIYKTSEDIRRSMTSDVNGQGSIWKFSFSASKSYTKMQHTIENATRYISDASSYHSSTQVELVPPYLLQLDPIAQLHVERFIEGKTYADDPQAYQGFIDQFGTHYFSKANFGGHIRVVYETNTNYFSSHTDEQAKKNAKASFLSFLSAHGGSVSESTSVETDFTDQSTETVRYYGGRTNLLSDDGLQTWQPTVDANPWLFSGLLSPISDLLTEGDLKSNMEEAVLQHVMRSYLAELRRLVTTIRNKLKASASIDMLERRLADMEVLPLGALVEADVEVLGHDIESALTVPSWFSDKTQLCFKWWPDGDGGQCGGGADRVLCARPGIITTRYRDDSDGRGGGCRMQWSIQSSGFDSWFSQVQVCYRWHADGDGGQCGGGASQMLCAPVNQYTPEYRDDTDGRGGGCQMSWRIVVPDDAPLWMRSSELCFSWYPDGDAGQCGPAPARDMCAKANEWTPFYRDDTDGRGGGCWMGWGLRLGF